MCSNCGYEASSTADKRQIPMPNLVLMPVQRDRCGSGFQTVQQEMSRGATPLSERCARDAYISRPSHCCSKGSPFVVLHCTRLWAPFASRKCQQPSASTTASFQSPLVSQASPSNNLALYSVMISFIIRKMNMRKRVRCAAKVRRASSSLSTSICEADQIWTRDFALHPGTSPAPQDGGIEKIEKLEVAVCEKLGCRLA